MIDHPFGRRDYDGIAFEELSKRVDRVAADVSTVVGHLSGLDERLRLNFEPLTAAMGVTNERLADFGRGMGNVEERVNAMDTRINGRLSRLERWREAVDDWLKKTGEAASFERGKMVYPKAIVVFLVRRPVLSAVVGSATTLLAGILAGMNAGAVVAFMQGLLGG